MGMAGRAPSALIAWPQFEKDHRMKKIAKQFVKGLVLSGLSILLLTGITGKGTIVLSP